MVKRELAEKKIGELYWQSRVLVINDGTQPAAAVMGWHLQHVDMDNASKEPKGGFGVEKLPPPKFSATWASLLRSQITLFFGSFTFYSLRFSAFLCDSSFVRDRADGKKGPEVRECTARNVNTRTVREPDSASRAEASWNWPALRAGIRFGPGLRFVIVAALPLQEQRGNGESENRGIGETKKKQSRKEKGNLLQTPNSELRTPS